MNIKNYTSGIDVSKTVARIEQLLVSAGADGIQKLYDKGQLSSLVFRIAVNPQKPPLAIKIPANVEQCLDVLWEEYSSRIVNRTQKTKEDFREQAARTAWKIVQDWTEVQITLIRLKQVDFIQVFMAYIVTGTAGQTYYEQLQETGFKALLPPSK